VDYLRFGLVCIAKKAFEAVEAFSDYKSNGKFEVVDRCFKLKLADYDTVYAPHSEVFRDASANSEGLAQIQDTFSNVWLKKMLGQIS
jgi:GT2 family glycosyltransferase|tara:strand:- start:2337 stop:2597 length:261 start_codon:yes stop_codon:yes gene_type:complete